MDVVTCTDRTRSGMVGVTMILPLWQDQELAFSRREVRWRGPMVWGMMDRTGTIQHWDHQEATVLVRIMEMGTWIHLTTLEVLAMLDL